MNRICKSFDDIGNIIMNYKDIPPLNYEMLLSEYPPEKINQDIVDTFVTLDGMSLSVEIDMSETVPNERPSKGQYEILAEIIEEELTEKFGSLEACYPHVVRGLFAEDNWKKATHKRMFWRVFGEKAIENLQNNMQSYSECKFCGAKIPEWDKEMVAHYCPKNTEGFLLCVDCGKQIRRVHAMQNRCEDCQKKQDKKIRSKINARQYQKSLNAAEEHKKEIFSRMGIVRTNKDGTIECITSLQ